jgi:hypothetical protein
VNPAILIVVALALVALIAVMRKGNGPTSVRISDTVTMTFPVDPYAGDEYETSNGRWQFDGQVWRQK